MDLYKLLMAQFATLCDLVCIYAPSFPSRTMAMDFYCLLQTYQMIFIFFKNFIFYKKSVKKLKSFRVTEKWAAEVEVARANATAADARGAARPDVDARARLTDAKSQSEK